MSKQLQRTEIELSNKVKIIIIHNLEWFGLDIMAALDNWLVRTKNYDSKSFCKYIRSKDPINIIALTEKEYNKMIN